MSLVPTFGRGVVYYLSEVCCSIQLSSIFSQFMRKKTTWFGVSAECKLYSEIMNSDWLTDVT